MYPTAAKKLPSGLKTTVIIYTSHYRFLNYCGIFPIHIDAKVLSISKCSLRSFWWWYNLATVVFIWSHFIFEVIQLYRLISGDVQMQPPTQIREALFSQCMWILSELLAAVTISAFYMKGKTICRFLTSWNQVEAYIMQEYVTTKFEELNSMMGTQQRWMWVVLFLQYSMNILAVFSVSGNNLRNLEYPAYVSSLWINLNVFRGNGVWGITLKVVSCVIEGWSTLLNRIVTSLFELLAFSFALNVNQLLAIMSLDRRALESAPTNTKELTESAGKALTVYNKLQELVEEFNRIFKWLLFMYKLLTMLQLCDWLYLACKLIIRPDYFGTFSGHVEITFAIPLSIFLFGLKLSLILVPMGLVEKRGTLFIHKWIYALTSGRTSPSPVQLISIGTNMSELRKMFKAVVPATIQFECGCFYAIQSFTLLTFFSVAATYLIVLLQV